jgi:beta-lactamase regulating signal transducer with metallopeptidase domain
MLAILGETFLHLLWQGALVGLAGAIAFRLAGPAASPVRYRLALGALVLFAAAPLVTVARSAGLLAGWGARSAGQAERISESTTPQVTAYEASALDGSSESGDPTPFFAGNGGQEPSRPDDALAWLGALWLVGAASLFARLGAGIVQVHRTRAGARAAPSALAHIVRQLERSMGGPDGVPVLLADRADIPFACGVFRPAMLIPAGLASDLSPGQIRAVLAHELAHVRRHDYVVNLGQRVLEALFFFHPAVHWLSRVARDEREHCCDELAAAVVGDRRAVAGALLALEEARGSYSPPLVPAAAGGDLLRRVERLLVHAPPGRRPWAVAALATLLASGGTMVLATPTTPATSELQRTAATPAPLTPAAGLIPTPEPDPPSVALEDGGPVVWTGELRAGERLRVRNIVGPIQVRRAAGRVGVVRARVVGAPPADLSFQVLRGADGVTLCALRAAHGRCNAEGYTWFGSPDEMDQTRIELVVELPSGVGVTAATFSGDLDLDGIDSDAEARTGTGTIAARLVATPESPSDRTLDLHTGSGTVRVTLPPGFGGELDSRFPSEVKHTSLGPGGNRLRVSSGSGALVLTRY